LKTMRMLAGKSGAAGNGSHKSRAADPLEGGKEGQRERGKGKKYELLDYMVRKKGSIPAEGRGKGEKGTYSLGRLVIDEKRRKTHIYPKGTEQKR